MDAIGDIQVNLNKNNNTLEYRFILELPNKPANYDMLKKFIWAIGKGRIKVSSKKVTWVLVTDEPLTIYSINSAKFYTTSMVCKMNFLKDTVSNGGSIDWYLSNRNNKYKNRIGMYESLSNNHIRNNENFPVWLSGYIEGKSYLGYKKMSNAAYFVIKQKYDKYLIQEIQMYFGVTSLVRSIKRNPNNFIFECYNKKILSNIIKHIIVYFLIGAKAIEFSEFSYKLTSR